MPFHLPFHFPFFYNNYMHYPNITNTNASVQNKEISKSNLKQEKKDSEKKFESSESFFEFLGLKLYFDDILIICILLFLYNEEVQDEELFMCLILLLIT